MGSVFEHPDLWAEYVANVTRWRFVPFAERVGLYSTLNGFGLRLGQSGQQGSFVYRLSVLTDEGWQASIGQPLLLLLSFWNT